MAAAEDDDRTHPDLYQLLGVARDASHHDIAQAWRRRARAEHPDTRPRDAAAADRFRVLAEAYQVLSDPVRRAAYDRAFERDRALGRQRRPRPGAAPASSASVIRVRPAGAGPIRVGPAGAGPIRVGPAGAGPIRVGPVRVEGPPAGPARAGWDEDEARLAVLAMLALRYLSRDRDWPW